MRTKKTSQRALARKTGLTYQRIGQLQREGVITPGEDPDLSIQKIIRHQGEIAAGRQPKNGQVDRMLEAALLDRAKREEIEIRIAEKRATLLPDELFVDGISTTFAALKTRLLSLPNRLRGKNPNWTQADIDNCDDEIREFLTELSDDRFPRHIRKRLAESRDRVEARAPANGKSVGRRQSKTFLRK